MKDAFNIMVDGDGISEYELLTGVYDPAMHQSGLWLQYRAAPNGGWQFVKLPTDAMMVRFVVVPRA